MVPTGLRRVQFFINGSVRDDDGARQPPASGTTNQFFTETTTAVQALLPFQARLRSYRIPSVLCLAKCPGDITLFPHQ